MTRRVLLLGAGGNAGMNFVKSLRIAQQYWVLGVDTSPHRLLACNSDEKALLSVHESDKCRVEAINRLIHQFNIDFVHAQPDQEVRFLAENHENIEATVFPHSLEKWNQFTDKYLCRQRWGADPQLAVAQELLATLTEDESLIEPLVSESGMMWIRARSGAGSRAALPVGTLAEAVSWANYWIVNRGLQLEDFVVSPLLPGPEYAVQTVWRRGVCIQSQARERLEYVFAAQMASGQSSTPSLARTVSDASVTATAHAAVTAVDDEPDGIYCVDLKTDAAGKIKPLEVNYGRFFTTTDFFATLGVNGPDTYVSLALGASVMKQIDAIHDEFFWVRGLDTDPTLLAAADVSLLDSSMLGKGC
jgi:carbamoyl-phosphate synthase large subunit